MTDHELVIVEVDGHNVDARRLDEFYNGSDGSRVTDSQWDESRDRSAKSLDDLRALGFEHVGTVCPVGHEIAEEVDGDGGMVTTDDSLGG